MLEEIQATMEEIRPYILSEGGDVEVVDYKGGIVYVRLLGACRNCPSSYITLKAGIENLLFDRFPEDISGVEQI